MLAKCNCNEVATIRVANKDVVKFYCFKCYNMKSQKGRFVIDYDEDGFKVDDYIDDSVLEFVGR